jgi:hypothetical protein
MKNTVSILFLIITGTLSAQNLSDYIPQNTGYIFSVNFAQLNAKSGQQDYTTYLQPLIRQRKNYNYDGGDADKSCTLLEVSDLMKTPADFGIDLQTAVMIYTTKTKDLSGTVYLIRLNKPEVFEARLNTSCKGQDAVQKKNSGQAVIYISNDMSVAVNGQVASVFVKDREYSYNSNDYENNYSGYADSLYLVESEADKMKVDSLFYERLNSQKNLDYEKEEQDFVNKADTMIIFRAKQRASERQAEIMAKKFAVIYDLMEKLCIPQVENINRNRNFTKVQEDRHDVFIYMNVLSGFTSDFFNPFRSAYYGREDALISATSQRRLTADISSLYTIDFENGKATVNVMNAYSKYVKPYMEKAYDVSQNKKLYKYIDAENLLGYMSTAVNAKELAKFYEDFYMELLDNLPKRKRDMDMVLGIQMFYSFIDKEMLFNTLSGQSILACTGFTDVKVKYSTYDYDDDFKKAEKIEERIEKQPRMVFVSALGNKENAKKLFNILNRFSVFTKLKDNVFVYYGNQYTPFNVYFALTEDAFIMTNDAALVQNNLGGYGKNRMMPKADQKFIAKHNLAFKIYGQKMLEGVRDTYFKNGETLPWFSQLMTNLGDIEMHDDKPSDNAYHVTAVITLRDQSSNALQQLLKMMSTANER